MATNSHATCCFLLIGLGLCHCSAGADSPVSPANVTRIPELPLALNIVEANPVTSSDATVADGGESGAADVGLAQSESSTSIGSPLHRATADIFDEEHSIAACSLFSRVRRWVAYSGQGDAFQCALQKILSTQIPLNMAPYDGNWHSYRVNTEGTAFCADPDDCSDIIMDFRVDNERFHRFNGRIDYGTIRSFDLKVCRDDQPVIARRMDLGPGYDFMLAESGVFESGAGSHQFNVVFESKLKQDFAFLEEKTVKMAFSSSYGTTDDFGRSSEAGELTLIQTPNQVAVTGDVSGRYASGYDWQEDFSGLAELLYENSGEFFLLADLEIQEGAGYGSVKDRYALGSAQESVFTEAWSDEAFLLDDDEGSEYLEHLENFLNQNSSARSGSVSPSTVTLEECGADIEAEFDLQDLSADDVADCAQFLISEDFTSCWYLVDS